MWGIEGFAWAWVAGTALQLCATVAISAKALGLRLSSLFAAIAAPLVAALIMASGVSAALWLAPLDSPLAKLVAGVVTGCIIYPAVLFAIAPQQLKEAIRFIRHRDEMDADGIQTDERAAPTQNLRPVSPPKPQ